MSDTLNFTTKTAHYVDAYDLTDFLKKIVGKNYDFGGSANDTDYTIEVYPPDTDQTYFRADQDEIDSLLEDGYIDLDCGSFQPALQYLADAGHIPHGSYVVRVSW